MIKLTGLLRAGVLRYYSRLGVGAFQARERTIGATGSAEHTLAGRTVVVTGGSSGIGLACAAEAVRLGARTIVCARGADALEDARATLNRAAPGRVSALTADVTDAGDVERVFDAAERDGGQLAVVHAAGVLSGIGAVVDADPAAWLETVRINLFGSFLVARAACRRLIARGEGGAVVLFSGGGATGPFPNYTAYGCGKAGVVRLVETLAQEVGPHGIRVNCVAPGFVATRIHEATLRAGAAAAGAAYLERTRSELQEGGVPAERAARAVAFLLSPASEGISGRLLAAVHDDWGRWPEHLAELDGSDLFTLRRIVPRDRGMSWQ
ncbi:MAG: SDR family NAD(P)-dependent oxidoreductase [Gemmatimonadales bacterium]